MVLFYSSNTFILHVVYTLVTITHYTATECQRDSSQFYRQFCYADHLRQHSNLACSNYAIFQAVSSPLSSSANSTCCWQRSSCTHNIKQHNNSDTILAVRCLHKLVRLERYHQSHGCNNTARHALFSYHQ